MISSGWRNNSSVCSHAYFQVGRDGSGLILRSHHAAETDQTAEQRGRLSDLQALPQQEVGTVP